MSMFDLLNDKLFWTIFGAVLLANLFYDLLMARFDYGKMPRRLHWIDVHFNDLQKKNDERQKWIEQRR